MIIIPATTILSILDRQLRLYTADYNDQINAYLFGYKDMINGFNWSVTPQNYTINSISYLIDTNTTSSQNAVDLLNSKFSVSDKSKYQFYTETYNGKEVISLHTILKTGIGTLTVSGDLFTSLGFDQLTDSGTASKESTMLYQIFNTSSYGNYNYLTECAKLLNDTFSTVPNSQTNKLQFSLDYNRIEVNKTPYVIISMASESPQDDTLNMENRRTGTDSVVFRTKRWETNYKLNIMSRQNSECRMIYMLLKSIIDGSTHIFDGEGLQKMQVSGGDALLEIEAMDRFFMTISLTFEYANENPIYIDRRGLSERLEMVSIATI